MRKFTLILITLLLSSCQSRTEGPELNGIYTLAKRYPGKPVCYLVLEPEEISGYYCIEYKEHI